jgi:hypothetical protein
LPGSARCKPQHLGFDPPRRAGAGGGLFHRAARAGAAMHASRGAMPDGGTHMEEELRPRPRDAQWSWFKIAMVVASLLAMAVLLLWDLER